jgi:hypothetical protein
MMKYTSFAVDAMSISNQCQVPPVDDVPHIWQQQDATSAVNAYSCSYMFLVRFIVLIVETAKEENTSQ